MRKMTIVETAKPVSRPALVLRPADRWEIGTQPAVLALRRQDVRLETQAAGGKVRKEGESWRTSMRADDVG